MANIRGLLGAIADLPGVINQGLLGPLPVDPEYAKLIGPAQMQAAQGRATTDFAAGLLRARGDPAGIAGAQDYATQGFQGRIFDLLKQQEAARMIGARERFRAEPTPENLPVEALQEVFVNQLSQQPQMLDPGWRVVTPEEADQLGLIPGHVYKTNGQDIEKLDEGERGPLVNVNVGDALSPLDKKRQELLADKEIKLEDEAEASRLAVANIDQTIEAAGKGLSGMLAPGAVGASAFLTSFGIDVAPDAIADTRTFQSLVNANIISWMSRLGGARGFSKEETAILQQAFPKVWDSPQARNQILSVMRKSEERKFNEARRGLDRVRGRVQDVPSTTLGPEMVPPLPSPPSGLPEGIPAGSKQIGTSGGKPVYQTPDGRRLIVE